MRALGVQHVMDSRTLTFADEVMEATNGAGIHLVLNALVGEWIPQSLRVLAEGGVFLEIGKREIWTPEAVTRHHPTARYLPYDLAIVAAEEP